MKFTKIAVAVALSTAAMASQAVTFETMTVTGGSFTMAGVGPNPFITANLTSGLDLLAGNNQQINTGGPLFNFGFFGPVNAFVSDGTYMPFGSAAAGGSASAPSASGDLGGSITVDLSAWTANWNGNNFGQGATATGTVDAAGNYNISWTSTVIGGAFDGQTGSWTMSGLVTAAPVIDPGPGPVPEVPEASTYGMMLAGLGLVGFAVRRRKLVA